MDQKKGGKWLIHDHKHCKDNQSQSLQIQFRISLLGCKHNACEFHIWAILFSMFSKKIRGQTHPWWLCYFRHLSMIYLQCINQF